MPGSAQRSTGIFQASFEDCRRVGLARRVRERLQLDGLVTLDGLGDRSAVVDFAQSMMAMAPHRDSEPDGLTVMRDTGRHADRPGFAGLGSGEVLPHTEGSGTPAPPRLLLLACSQAARSGGVSSLVDGAVVLAELAAHHGVALEALSAPRSAFFGGSDGCLTAVITAVAESRVHLRFRQDSLARFSPEAAQYLTLLQSIIERHSRPVLLRRGQAFLLDNHRWLHARSAFTGPRRLYRALGEPLTSWAWSPGFPFPHNLPDAASCARHHLGLDTSGSAAVGVGNGDRP